MTADSGHRVLAELLQRPFYKMSGSGNDFVFLDASGLGAAPSVPADVTAALCARGPGIGADGLVVLDALPDSGVRIAYYNSDGSRATLCGNATLCAAALADRLGLAPSDAAFRIATDAGVLKAEVRAGQGPRFQLEPVADLDPTVVLPDGVGGAIGALRAGFGVAGVPHLVVQVPDVERVDLNGVSPALRRATTGRPDGANVNYVSRSPSGGWRMRTFERGVEGETLACGTGAVASATLLAMWGEAGTDPGATISLETRSGRHLVVTPPTEADRRPWLGGEGRLVFTGTLPPNSLRALRRE